MKSLRLTTFVAAVIVSLGFWACNPLNKMKKNAPTITYDVTPDPLEMHGDTVIITATGKFPPKYFHKKATVKVTPVIKDASGNVVKEMDPIMLIGEDADGDGQKINFEKGGSYTYTTSVPYSENLADVLVYAKAEAIFKGKSKVFDEVEVGKGTIATSLWVQSDDRPILGKDEFKKVIPRSISADLHYLVNSSQVRNPELRDEDMKAMMDFISDGAESGLVFKGVTISAYASPDGEISLNENLANDRASSASKALARQFRRSKVEAASAEGFMALQGKGEDWDGFKKAMEMSSIQDKQLIIRVLKMYSDLNKREEEIKNLAATYTEIREQILPDLRRSQITINAEEQARTDAEITRLTKAAPDSLSVEELLYAATLTNDMGEKLACYQNASRLYPKDWRGPNNVGYIYLLQSKVSEAKAEFQKAAGLASNNPVINNNLGIIARLEGDRAQARQLLSSATAAGNDVNYNLGILDIIGGNYSSAVSNMSGAQTFNAALATLMSGNADGALNIVDQSDDKSTAAGYYLKAIAGARKSNKDLVINNLKAAFAKDATLKAKAKVDAEFLAYRGDNDFDTLLN
ncbi:MAG: hypothetical protein ACFB10_18325 [Salibacteraceae bacterium]